MIIIIIINIYSGEYSSLYCKQCKEVVLFLIRKMKESKLLSQVIWSGSIFGSSR